MNEQQHHKFQGKEWKIEKNCLWTGLQDFQLFIKILHQRLKIFYGVVWMYNAEISFSEQCYLLLLEQAGQRDIGELFLLFRTPGLSFVWNWPLNVFKTKLSFQHPCDGIECAEHEICIVDRRGPCLTTITRNRDIIQCPQHQCGKKSDKIRFKVISLK